MQRKKVNIHLQKIYMNYVQAAALPEQGLVLWLS